MSKKTGEFTGNSTLGIQEAIHNALEKAGEHSHFEIIETFAQGIGENRNYEVVLSTFLEELES